MAKPLPQAILKPNQKTPVVPASYEIARYVREWIPGHWDYRYSRRHWVQGHWARVWRRGWS